MCQHPIRGNKSGETYDRNPDNVDGLGRSVQRGRVALLSNNRSALLEVREAIAVAWVSVDKTCGRETPPALSTTCRVDRAIDENPHASPLVERHGYGRDEAGCVKCAEQ